MPVSDWVIAAWSAIKLPCSRVSQVAANLIVSREKLPGRRLPPALERSLGSSCTQTMLGLWAQSTSSRLQVQVKKGEAAPEFCWPVSQMTGGSACSPRAGGAQL